VKGEGCALGLLIAGLLWIVIFAGLAVIIAVLARAT
jgi:hypothetical protein